MKRSLVVLVLFAASCGRRSPEGTAPPPSALGSASALPVDHALPGELAEGDDKAFGLPIPRRMRVTGRFSDVVFASGALLPEHVANYVRQRVIAERVETGPGKTVFARATVKEAPGRVLRIDVISRNGEAEIRVRDESRPPAPAGGKPEEEWGKHGLLPDGTPADPTRFE